MVKRFFVAVQNQQRLRVYYADLLVIIKRRKKIRPILPEYNHEKQTSRDDRTLSIST